MIGNGKKQIKLHHIHLQAPYNECDDYVYLKRTNKLNFLKIKRLLHSKGNNQHSEETTTDRMEVKCFSHIKKTKNIRCPKIKRPIKAWAPEMKRYFLDIQMKNT